MLDQRELVTYSDSVYAADGTIRVMHKHNRTPDGVIQMAVFTAADVRAGK